VYFESDKEAAEKIVSLRRKKREFMTKWSKSTMMI
jgi:hypothetical protein